MKKMFFASLIGLTPFLLSAQDIALNTTNLPLTPGTTLAASEPANPTKATKTARREARETRQFSRAAKFFNHDFQNASDVTWSTQKDAFVASFTKAGNRSIAMYGKDGRLLYSMVSYSADQLPAAEQSIIHDAYDGYKMTWVNEVHQNDIVVYVVHLENDRNIKLVTVCNGNTNIYREYQKM